MTYLNSDLTQLKYVGEGSYGIVFLSRDEKAVIKIGDIDEKEIVILKHLEKEGFNNTSKIIEYDLDNRELVMEYIKGLSYIDERLTIEDFYADFLKVYIELLWHGVIHRDVHPGNFILGDDGEVYVIDFGQSYLSDSIESAEFIKELYQDLHDIYLSNYISDFTLESIECLIGDFIGADIEENLDDELEKYNEPIPIIEDIINILWENRNS